MTRPNIQIPKEFAINGEKADFTQEKIQTGFDKLNPDIFAGDNANKFIDDTYKGLNGVLDLYNGIVLHDMTTTYDDKAVVGKFIENSFKLYSSLVNPNTGHEVTETEYWEEVALGGGGGLEIGDIGMALYVDETKGLRRYLNGQIVDINTNTQAFLNRLKEITTLHPSLLCTEEEWQTAKTMSTFGQVGKFVFNYSGDNIVSVRIPAIVNVQGLFDLQNLGMTVSAGLPNITGAITNGNGWENISATGSLGIGSYLSNYGAGHTTGNNSNAITFDASRSNPIYGNSNTVQQEATQYPYFIQIATGSETEANIINEIELNNPYSLFDSKYSDHELNNLSWLKSEGQWNAKAVYPTAYDKLLKVYNGTETVEGLSVKLSTETYTDYDFVLNTADESFRLPLKNGDNIIFAPKEGSGSILETFTTTKADAWEMSTLIAPVTGWYWAFGSGSITSSATRGLYLGKGIDSEEWQSARSIGPSGRDLATNHIWLNKGETFKVRSVEVKTRTTYYIEADIPNLYFYVGETVQNANLIDAGRIGEQMLTRGNKEEIISWGIPDYSAGITQTVNIEYTATTDGFVYVFAFGNLGGFLSVNGTNIHFQNGNASNIYAGASCFIPVAKNDVYKFTWTGGHEYEMSFFPMKGAN